MRKLGWGLGGLVYAWSAWYVVLSGVIREVPVFAVLVLCFGSVALYCLAKVLESRS